MRRSEAARSTGRVSIALLAALAVGCKDEAASPAPVKPVRVTTATVQRRDVPIYIEAVGTLKANQVAIISPQIPGNLTALKFKDGDRVKAGELLAVLDNDVQRNALAAAKAELETKLFVYDKNTKLFAAQASTEYELEQALHAKNKAEADVKKAQAVLDKLSIAAPFDGRLSIHQRDVGDYLAKGDPIINLVDDDPMLLDYSVPEKYVDRLAVGQTVLAHMPETQTKAQGKLRAFNPQIDTDTRAIHLRAEIPNADHTLISGRFVHVDHQIGTNSNALVIPQQAVVLSKGGAGVFVVKNDTARRAAITLGDYVGTEAIVTDGLSEGDVIVLTGWQKLHEGAKVTVRDDAKPLLDDARDKQAADSASGDAAR